MAAGKGTSRRKRSRRRRRAGRATRMLPTAR